MTQTTALLLLAGAFILLIGMLVIVGVARRLDNGAAMINIDIRDRFANALGKKGYAIAADQSDQPGDKSTKSKKQGKAVASVFASLAVVGGIAAFVKSINKEDITPVVSELTTGQLHGTMVNVRNSDPVVLILPGSGPTDRDGNNTSGLKTDAYKLLAEGLAEEGIASVRIDKSGMYGSAGAGDPNSATAQSYAVDYHAWIDAIKAERGSKCVWLLGHSEGALMVSLAAEGRDDVCGLILVAGMGRNMSAVIRDQLRANPANAPVLDQAMHALDELEAGRHIDTTDMHPALLPLFRPAVQDYLISMFRIDPVEAVRRAGKNTLIVQGTTDMQVSVEDAKLLNAAPKTRLKLIDGMNHILKEAPADRAANLATYSDPSFPLAPKLVRRIEDFIKNND